MGINIFRKPHRLLIKLLVSYLLILALPVLISVVVYRNTLGVLEDRLADSQRTMLELVSRKIEDRMFVIQRLMIDIDGNRTISDLINHQNPNDRDFPYSSFRAVEEMMAYESYNRGFGLFYVQLMDADVVVFRGGVYPTNLFLNSHYAEGLASAGPIEGVRPFLTWQAAEYVQALDPSGAPHPAIRLETSLPLLNTPDRPSAKLVILLDASDLLSAIPLRSGIEGASIALTSADGRVLASSSGAEVGDRLTQAKGDSVLERRIEPFGWTLRLAMPAKVLWHDLDAVRLLVVLSILASLALGGVLVWFLANRQYAPVGSLVRDISRGSGRDYGGEDELAFIGDTITTQLRRACLRQWLRSGPSGPMPEPDTLAACALVFPHEQFAVVTVKCDRGAPRADLIAAIAASGGDDVLTYDAEGDDLLPVVLNFAAEPGSGAGRLPAALSAWIDRFLSATKDGLGLDAHLGVSTVRDRALDLPQLFEEAVQAMDFRVAAGAGQVALFADLDALTQRDQVLTPPVNGVIKRVMEFISDNSADRNLNISTIADRFEMNADYLSRLFKQGGGIGILDYLNQRRIERAKVRLTDGEEPLQEIATQVGFTEVNTFIRVFKRIEGLTPGRFREEVQTAEKVGKRRS